MRTILTVSILATLVILSSGCKSSTQTPANSNNPNMADANASPGIQMAMPSPTGPQQGMNQPGVNPQANPAGPDAATMDPAATSLSMIAMDYQSSLLQTDKAKVEPLLADEYQRTRSDGTVVNKAQELASLKKVDDMFSMEAQPAQIKGDTATVSGKITLRSKDKPEQSRSVQTTITFRKVKDKWLVVSSVEKKV